MLSGVPHKDISQNGCYLKITGCIDLIIYVHVLGAYVHIYSRYEFSMIKPVARMTLHRQHQ